MALWAAELCWLPSGGTAEPEGWHAPVNASYQLRHREEVRRMFTFGYDNYMEHAFPLDELNPHACSGRGVGEIIHVPGGAPGLRSHSNSSVLTALHLGLQTTATTRTST